MSQVLTENTEITIDPPTIADFCSEVSFAPGDIVRRKGQYYTDMYLLTDGEVEITLDKKGKSPKVLTRQRGAPIGEISFLEGRPATAQVTARTPTRALLVDNTVLAAIEQTRPELAAELYRQFATVAEGRQSYNLLFFTEDAPSAKPADAPIEVRLCRNPQMLRVAQGIRYEVYCEELGRTSPFADVKERIIADDLDTFAHVLLAYEGETPVGTMRMNASKEGSLGALEQIYGMSESPHHPEHTSICTKFIVKKSHRFSQASFKMMATSMAFGQHSKMKSCYMDCIPQLLPFYMSLGFRQSAAAFLHRENGRSIPMSLDIERYASRIGRLTGFILR